MTQVEKRERKSGWKKGPKHACAVCYRQDASGPEFLLVRTKGSRRWVLPKGKIEKKETPWDAAAREAREEAGARGRVSQELLRVFTYKKKSGKPISIMAFLLAVDNILDDGETDREPTWFRQREAKEALGEGRQPRYAAELAALIESACRILST